MGFFINRITLNSFREYFNVEIVSNQMVSDFKKCRYCLTTYNGGPKEHVFPKGLGGQDIFMDNVCGTCNKKFMDYERSLMRDSPIAFVRSVEGIEGYRRDLPKGAFLAPILLTFDEDTKVTYEVGQRYPFENFIRPQYILINDTFYIEGDKRESLQRLDDKFHEWKRDVRIISVKRVADDKSSLQWIEFVDDGSRFNTVINFSATKVKDIIKVDLLPDTHSLYDYFSPRLFLNDLDELRVRAKSIEEAVAFLTKLMNHTRTRVALTSYRKGKFIDPIIYVSQHFNNLQVSQCLVKIGVNCLMYYYPTFRDSTAFEECITFIMTAKNDVKITTEERSSIKDFGDGTHNLFFQQMTYGMNIRLSFFSGAGGVFCFDVKGLIIMKPGEFNRLVIDYRSRIMALQDRSEFLASFNKK
jgi:hypothetical protein